MVCVAVARGSCRSSAALVKLPSSRGIGAVIARRLAQEGHAVIVYGRINVLVNNAGIMPPGLPPLADTEDATSIACSQ